MLNALPDKGSLDVGAKSSGKPCGQVVLIREHSLLRASVAWTISFNILVQVDKGQQPWDNETKVHVKRLPNVNLMFTKLEIKWNGKDRGTTLYPLVGENSCDLHTHVISLFCT